MIRNARLLVGDGTVVDAATVVVDDSRIVAAGAQAGDLHGRVEIDVAHGAKTPARTGNIRKPKSRISRILHRSGIRRLGTDRAVERSRPPPQTFDSTDRSNRVELL